MARTCTVCAHEQRKEIEKSLVLPNAKFRVISQQFGVSTDALRRHIDNGHIKAKIQKVQQAVEVMEAEDFLTHLVKRRTRFDEMVKEAQDAKDPGFELRIYTVEGKFTEMEGRIKGVFKGDKPPAGDNPPASGLLVTPKTLKKIGDILAKGDA
jgi:hypothetical protein